MLTRRTATVTMSAPDASCARAMIACELYFPVPMISRDENVRPAMTNGESLIQKSQSPNPKRQDGRISISNHQSSFIDDSPAAHEIDDLHLVAVAHDDVREAMALDDRKVVLDGDAPRVDVEPFEQRDHA